MHLILNSFGASLTKANGIFCVSTPQGEQQLHPKDVASISISKGARISSDAILLAISNEIDVLFIDQMGQPQGRVWSVKYGSISDIRKKQLEFFYSHHAVAWVKQLIVEKLNNQQALIMAFRITQDDVTGRHLNRAITSLEDYKNKIRSAEAEVISDIGASLRGWEGAGSRKYFQSLAMCLPEKYKFEQRSQHPAKDMFNAMLNYGYGMLYGKIEGALIKAGIDPYVGIFHRDDYNRPALVFDVIEKYRIWVDFVVMQLCLQDAMTEACFTQTEDQFLLDGLGKRILIQSVNDYLAEVISHEGMDRSRQEHIQQHAHRLAKLFLDSK